MKVKAYGKSVIGSREMNQDSMLLYPERSVFAVADGVGGGMKGEVASLIAVTNLKTLAEGQGQLKKAVLRAQEAVLHEAMTTIGEALMGSTLTAVRIHEGLAEICHVGDSRCYLYTENHLRQLTEDHELYDESIQAPVLSSYLGISPDVAPLTIQEEMVPVIGGERLLICSDGLYKQVSENRIVEVIEQHSSFPETLLETLCSEASQADFSDNITIVYIELE
jgi:PPM family protein phosphatase